jgi:hypothetical protein
LEYWSDGKKREEWEKEEYRRQEKSKGIMEYWNTGMMNSRENAGKGK